MDECVNKIKEEFKALTFNEEKHLYYVDGKQLNYSVSGIIKKFVEPFDSDTIAERMAKYGEKTKEEILKEWDEKRIAACDKGTRVHLFGEMYPFDRTLKPSDGYEEAIVKFWNIIPDHIVPVIMEAQMYHKKHMFAGTADILLYNKKTDKYIIGDYKTNIDLFKNYKKKKMLRPFNDMLDMPFSKYEIQLSAYQMLFEQTGYEVENRRIVWLRPDGNFEIYDTKDYRDVIEDYLEKNYI